jgi:hypothetical protein
MECASDWSIPGPHDWPHHTAYTTHPHERSSPPHAATMRQSIASACWPSGLQEAPLCIETRHRGKRFTWLCICYTGYATTHPTRARCSTIVGVHIEFALLRGNPLRQTFRQSPEYLRSFNGHPHHRADIPMLRHVASQYRVPGSSLLGLKNARRQACTARHDRQTNPQVNSL